MSNAAAHAHAFYRQVAKDRKVWTVRDEGGYPAPKTRTGVRAQPFWSSLSRVKKIIATVPAYAGFTPEEFSWEEFRDRWLVEIKNDKQLVGVNWSGAHASGYDIDSDFVQRAVEFQIKKIEEPNSERFASP